MRSKGRTNAKGSVIVLHDCKQDVRMDDAASDGEGRTHRNASSDAKEDEHPSPPS